MSEKISLDSSDYFTYFCVKLLDANIGWSRGKGGAYGLKRR